LFFSSKIRVINSTLDKKSREKFILNYILFSIKGAKMNKKILFSYVGAVAVSLVLMSTSMNVLGAHQYQAGTTLPVICKNVNPMRERMSLSGVNHAMAFPTLLSTDVQVTSEPEPENNPAVGSDPDNDLLLAYTFEEEIYSTLIPWTYSTDGGQTFDPGVYYDIAGAESHPAIDFRGSPKQFVGTLQGDPMEGDGAIQYLFTCDDPTDYETYSMVYWVWSDSYPYSNRRIPDIAGYNGLEETPWWYGITVCVGTRGAPGSVDMPIFNYMDYADENSGWSNYFANYSGCKNAAIDIDQTNGYFYAVFDYLNASKGDWDLLVFRGDCHNNGEGHPNFFNVTFLGGPENTTNPVIAVHDNKVQILAETDAEGTQDIICYYSDDAGVTWHSVLVTQANDADETYPSIIGYGTQATCLYTQDQNIFVCYTKDAGATWINTQQVNDENGMVQSAYRNMDIAYDGTTVWTDLRNGNADIYLDNVGGTPPHARLQFGNITFGLGKVSAVIKNVGDADAVNTTATIAVRGGILGRVNKTKTVTTTIEAGKDITVTTEGIIFGFGYVTIMVSADCAVSIPPHIQIIIEGRLIFVFFMQR